VIFSLRRLFLR